MSSSEQATSSRLSGRERGLLFVLAMTTIPLREGGGVVFPRSFPGKGYRLDEWQFDRYRAAMERTILGEDARRRSRIFFATFLLYGASMLLVALYGSQLRSSPALAEYYGRWIPLAIVLLASSALILVPRFLRTKAYSFSRPFLEGAPPVSRFAFRRERILRIFATGVVNPMALLGVSGLAGGAAVGFFLYGSFVSTRPVLHTLLGLLCLLFVMRRIYWLFEYWRFRLKHGRGPAEEDFRGLTLAS